MQKTRYELDPYNRLILDGTGTKSGLSKFRAVLDGKFKLDGNNNLSYHIKTPLSGDDTIPNQLRLQGTWALTDTHDLRFTLDKKSRETFGDEITIRGEIMDVNDTSLVFGVTTRSKDDTRSTYILDLKGSWKADKNNRLSFHVKKESGTQDILTFNGTWEMNRNHQIVYEYEKAVLTTKKRQKHTLTFKGYWDIKGPLRISYVLSGNTDTAFTFKTSAGVFKENSIQYELGIELAGRAKPMERTIALCGKWRLKKNVGLVFEVKYENKKVKAIVFGADAKLTDKDTVSFRLKDDRENKNIGVTIELSRKILKGDGEAFLRVLASKGESAVYAGAAWRW